MSRFITPCAAMPTACTTKRPANMTASPAAYRIKLTSAYVVDPDKPMDIPKLAREEDRKTAFEAIKASTHQGYRDPRAAAGAARHDRGCVGIMEGLLDDLPSEDYFLKTLYRQHYPGEDEDGIPPWMQDFYRQSRPLKPARPSRSSKSMLARPRRQIRTVNLLAPGAAFSGAIPWRFSGRTLTSPGPCTPGGLFVEIIQAGSAKTKCCCGC